MRDIVNLKLIIPVAAIAIGTGLYGLSQKAVPQPVTEVIAPENKIRVWRIKRDLSPGEEVSRSDFKSELLNENEANEIGVIEDISLDFIRHMVAGYALQPNQIVRQSDFVSPDDDNYINLIIGKGKVPYAIKVSAESIVGGLIRHGTLVDIIALSSATQNLASSDSVAGFESVSISPVLMAVKVIKVQQEKNFMGAERGLSKNGDVNLIIELSRKQLARLLVAKKIAQLEVYKSVGREQAELLKANSGDVLPTYKAIKEYRASDTDIR